MKVAFELTGEMPLLMHWDNIDGADELKAWRQAPENKNFSVPGDDRSPPWTWQTYCYLDTDGERVVMPQDNVMRAMMYGGAQVILKRQKTFKEISQSGILIQQEHLDFTFGNNRTLTHKQMDEMREDSFSEQSDRCKELGFRLFVKRAGVAQSKHVRVRPRFDTWTVRGTLEVRAAEITYEALSQIFEYAGRGGLCDWRPSSPKRPGPYGQFVSKLKKF